jgi:hypothetical protein
MLNKLVLRALLSLSLAFSFAGGANAALITQDILDGNGGSIGSISINTNNVDEFGEVLSWEAFNIFGIDMSAPDVADGSQFLATFEAADFSLGLQDFSFDLIDTLGAYAWSGQFWEGFGDFVAFDLGVTPDPAFAGYVEFTLGEATVVPTPATLVLFLTAVVGLVARRKKH